MNVGDFFMKAAVRYPNNTALISNDIRVSYKQLLERMYRLSNALRDLGLKKGDRVAVLMQNSIEIVDSLFGPSSFAGLVVVHMNTRYSADEHLHMLNDSGASAIIMGEEFQEVIASILPDAKTVKVAISVADKPRKGILSYNALLAKASPENPEVKIDEDDIFNLRYTAGTTGPSKGTIITHRATVTHVLTALMEGAEIEEGDAIALTGPITHASGSMVIPYIMRGGIIFPLPGFDSKELMSLIQQEGIKTLYLVPTMIVMILNHPDRDKYDLSSIKNIRYGASPIAPDVLKKAIEVFGNVFVQGYGLTESLNPVTILTKKDHIVNGDEKKLERLKSVGRETILAKVRIMDDDNNFLPAGEVGEIVVQTDSVMKGYWKNPEATAESIKDGWLHTRDVGYIDEDGYVFLIDRKGDMIISGGFNVYPREVEDVLYSHQAVLEAAVFGVPDEKWVEAVKAAIVLRPGMKVTEKELIEYCGKHLAGFKKPKSVDFLESLPKSEAGKIQRRILKEPYWKDRGRMV